MASPCQQRFPFCPPLAVSRTHAILDVCGVARPPPPRPAMASDMAGPQNAWTLRSIICVKLCWYTRFQRGTDCSWAAMSTLSETSLLTSLSDKAAHALGGTSAIFVSGTAMVGHWNGLWQNETVDGDNGSGNGQRPCKSHNLTCLRIWGGGYIQVLEAMALS